jgi:hypothetical protein
MDRRKTGIGPVPLLFYREDGSSIYTEISSDVSQIVWANNKGDSNVRRP